MKKYRIPKLEEFIPGFKYEIYTKTGGGSFAIVDLAGDPEENNEQIAVNRLATIEDWEEHVVGEYENQFMFLFDLPFSLEWFFKKRKNVELKFKK